MAVQGEVRSRRDTDMLQVFGACVMCMWGDDTRDSCLNKFIGVNRLGGLPSGGCIPLASVAASLFAGGTGAIVECCACGRR
jgi:hypothetical protein